MCFLMSADVLQMPGLKQGSVKGRSVFTVTGRTSKMLKGQEANIPFVITCCSSIALVEWGSQVTLANPPLPRLG